MACPEETENSEDSEELKIQQLIFFQHPKALRPPLASAKRDIMNLELGRQ